MEIQSAVEKYEDDSGRAERFMKLVERYTGFEEITPIMIHEFVEKIVVHSKENQYVQSSPQRIEIHLNFIGEFELPNTEQETTPEENGTDNPRPADGGESMTAKRTLQNVVEVSVLHIVENDYYEPLALTGTTLSLTS